MGKQVSAKKALAKEAKKEKQLAKARRKQVRESGGGSGEAEDIDELLKTFAKTAARGPSTPGKLVECNQPSPRAACTLTPLPSGELFLFGGEFFDGSQAQVFNEAYRWNPTKNLWRKVEPGFADEASKKPVVPAPRCSHQAVFYNGAVYIWGGEFSTVDQFHHFQDLWRCDIKSNSWEELKCTGTGPSARSGHRMVVWRNLLVVFGGFHDTVRDTRYFNDLHVLNFQTLKWSRVPVAPHAHIPSPRSGVIMAAHSQGASPGILVCGGYCKIKETQRSIQGKMLEDAWWIDMKEVSALLVSKSSAATEGRAVWEKLGRKACLPSLRSGTASVVHKSMVVCFGGVCDLEDEGLVLRSIFYNDLHVFDLERRRWHMLKLHTAATPKKTKKAGATIPAPDSVESQAGAQDTDSCLSTDTGKTPDDTPFEYDEDCDEETFGYYDQDGRLVRIRIDTLEPCAESPPKAEAPGSEVLKSPSAAPSELMSTLVNSPLTQNVSANEVISPEGTKTDAVKEVPATSVLRPEFFPEMQCPLPRLNAALVMSGNDLIVYGGVLEVGKRQYTLDDCWSININQRKEWKCLIKGHLDEHPWHEDKDEDEEGSSSSSDSSDTSDDEDKDSDSEGENESDESSISDETGAAAARATVRDAAKRFPRVRDEIDFLQAALRDTSGSKEPETQTLATPGVGETLQHFFARSHQYWTQKYCESVGEDHRLEPKAARKGAFVLAAERYDAVRPILRRLLRLENSAAPNP